MDGDAAAGDELTAGAADGGGAATIQQVIAAGLLDQLLINQAPILLGGGERLLDGLAPDAARFELADLVKGPEALHLTYRVY